MMLAEDSGLVGATWETYAATDSFTILNSEGTHTVYIVLQDYAGNISDTWSDTIILDRSVPELQIIDDTVAFTSAAQVFTGTIGDSSLTADSLLVTFNGIDSTVAVVAGTFNIPVTLVRGLNTLSLSVTDTPGNSVSITRVVVFADTIIQTDTADTEVTCPAPAADTGVIVVDLPRSDTLVQIIIPVYAADGSISDDTWLVEIDASDTNLNFIAQNLPPDSFPFNATELYFWNEFKHSIFAFDIISDTGEELSDSTATFDELWVTFHPSSAILQGLSLEDRNGLRVCWFDEDNNEWIVDGNTIVDAAAGTIRAQLGHFSIYAVFSIANFATAAANLSNVTIYPNPYIPYDGDNGTGVPYAGVGDGSGIYMNGLVPGTKIEIYDIRGRMVEEMTVPAGTGAVQWDVRNSGGEEVASDVYLVLFRSGSEQVVQKLFVVK